MRVGDATNSSRRKHMNTNHRGTHWAREPTHTSIESVCKRSFSAQIIEKAQTLITMLGNHQTNQQYRLKRLKDGRAMLNLACGSRMHLDWNNVDSSPLARLAKHGTVARLMHAMYLLSDRRFERLARFDSDILLWNLTKGIPFDNSTFDVVYHSHFLEHLDVQAGDTFLGECYRVLKPSGILRVVVPDLEVRCYNYMQSLNGLSNESPHTTDAVEWHEWTIRELIGQMIVGEPAGTSEQPPVRRAIERLVRGSTARIGEVHRWMYDRYTLREKLRRAGFADIRLESPASGRIRGWAEFLLDVNEDGSTYKPDSIYMEGMRPMIDSAYGVGCEERPPAQDT